jgi:large subunit ribosomal protein L17
MRHHDKTIKLSRTTDQRTALVRSLMVSLIKHKQITTTIARAKAIQPKIEKLVTLAKKGDLASRRLVLSRLGNNPVATKELCDAIAPSYTSREGGYTRIIKKEVRKSDGAPQVIIQMVA